MAHYFTREEAEALLPEISVVLRKIQESHRAFLRNKEELDSLRLQAAGNGHHLLDRMVNVQRELSLQAHAFRKQLDELTVFGCELKDAERGLIDFLSLRNGEQIYLCWYLGEGRINYWHDLDTGFAGRQPLD
jgi:hypothetical protein